MTFKRTIPLLICGVFGVLFALQYYVPAQLSQDLYNNVAGKWISIIAGISAGLGVVSVCRLHWGKIRRGAPGWGFSIVTFVGFLGMTGVGLVYLGVQRTKEGEPTPFGWLFANILSPLQRTMFSVLAFYIASAAYRAFRARTWEATLLLVTAMVIMLGRVPMGDWMWTKVGGGKTGVSLSEVVVWVMGVPNMAAQRAVGFGLTLGVIATSLKIIFGIERAYLGGGKE